MKKLTKSLPKKQPAAPKPGVVIDHDGDVVPDISGGSLMGKSRIYLKRRMPR